MYSTEERGGGRWPQQRRCQGAELCPREAEEYSSFVRNTTWSAWTAWPSDGKWSGRKKTEMNPASLSYSQT